MKNAVRKSFAFLDRILFDPESDRIANALSGAAFALAAGTLLVLVLR